MWGVADRSSRLALFRPGSKFGPKLFGGRAPRPMKPTSRAPLFHLAPSPPRNARPRPGGNRTRPPQETATLEHPPRGSSRPSDMSYYFVIVGTQDNPLFEYEFGTSKQGGDGAAHFADQARSMNQFIVHSSLDILEEVQWSSGQMYAFPSMLFIAHLRPFSERTQSSSPRVNFTLPNQPPRQTRELTNHSEQVPETHRPLLQQLHLRLRNPYKRKVPPPPPACRPLPLDPLLLRRCEPALLRN